MADSNPVVVEYRDIVEKEVSAYVSCSEKLGGDVHEQAKSAKNAFVAQCEFLTQALTTKTPDQFGLQKMLQPSSDNIGKVQKVREAKRSSPYYNHLSAVSEAIPALGWVCDSNKPSLFVKEMNESGQFYLNKVLIEHKGKNDAHVEWANSWKSVMTKLHQYVLKNCPKGVKWNLLGSAGKPTLPPKPTSATKPGGPAPPPPPPPGPGAKLTGGNKVALDRSALFAELSQGDKISSTLKHVPEELKTHKNPSLKDQSALGPRPFRSVQTGSDSAKRENSKPVVKHPVFKLEDKRWRVEHQHNRHDLEIDVQNLKENVYVFDCKDCTVVVHGKLSSIVMDNCEKVGVLCDSLLSTLEFVNCKSITAQVLGSVPTVNVDKTDGCQLYVSKDSIGVDIVHAKTSAFNLHVPSSDDAPEGDFSELNVPEQFKTTFNKKTRKIETVPTDIHC